MLGALAAVMLPVFAEAQGPSDGAVHGQVLDVRRSPISGAQITLIHAETGLAHSARTDRSGQYLIVHLAPGLYRVSTRAAGFAESREAGLQIQLGETRELVTALRVGAAAEITVSGQNAQEANSFSLDRVLTGSELALLPANGRRWQDFALMLPGVNPDPDDDGLISVRGLASTQNSTLVDGAEANQSFGSVPAGTGSEQAETGGSADNSDATEQTTGPAAGLARSRHSGVSYSFSQAAVREFRVTGESYSAALGHAGGAVVTTVSRSGGTTLHGSEFFVLRSQAFAARNPFNVAVTFSHGVAADAIVKPHDLRENFGGTLGGPVRGVRNLFFFYTHDQQRRGFPAVSSPANPAFYSLTAVQTGLLGTRGVTPRATAAALTYLDSLTGLTPRRADQEIDFGRVDWAPGGRTQLGLEYNRVRWRSPAGLTDAPVVARGRASLGNAAGSLDAVLARVSSTLNPRLINQLTLQYLRDLQLETPQTPLTQEPAIGPGGLAPEVNIGPEGLLFGTPATLSQQAYPDERRLEANDTLTMQRGHHLVELGVQFSAVDDRIATLANAAGTFDYDSTRTTANAGGLVDFITDYTFNVNAYPNGGCPSITAAVHLFCFTSFTQSFGPQRIAFGTEEWAGFAQDTWRPRGGLSFSLGLRYEYELLPLPQRPNAALDAAFGTQGATGVFPEDRNNIGPRAGLTWEPFGPGRGLVRAGYGLYFGRLPGATIASALADTDLPGSTTRIRITPAVETTCPQATGAAGQGFGYPCSFSQPPAGAASLTGSAIVFDRRFRLPVVEQGSLTLEREAGAHASLAVEYVFNVDRQLASSTDLNIAPSAATGLFQLQGGVSAGETFAVPVYAARVDPSFGPVTEVESNADATYNGLVVSARVKPWRGFAAQANYTWSKALDDGANQTATPQTDGQFDPRTNGYDKGLSSLNYPQALHLAAAWTPRVAETHGWARRLLNGWEVAPIVTARSGRAYSYDVYGGTRLAGGHMSLNGSGGAVYLPTVGRNTLRLPATVNSDLRVGRGFRPGGHVGREPLELRFAAEIFNVTNRLNLSSVEQRAYLVGTAVGGVTPLVFQSAAAIAAEGLNEPAFGAPTSASTSLARERQIQVSCRMSF